MKEFIEKMIERLEEEIQDVSESQSSYEVGSDMSITCSHIMGTLRDVKNRIIPKLAEEYKDKVMINGQYCWQTCSATEHCKKCNRLCNGSIDYYENYDVFAEGYNNGWIPCSRELPKNGIHVLCYGKNSLGSFKYEVSVYAEKIECWMCSKIADVIAWQPLPAPYRSEKSEKAEWKDAFMRHFTKIE